MKKSLIKLIPFALLGVLLTNCTKDKLTQPLNQSESVQYSSNCPGGGEDEDPILIGGTVDTYEDPINNVTIKSFHATSGNYNDMTTSSSDGSFCFQLEPGYYDFVFIANGFMNDTLDSINITRDTSMVITLN